MLKIVLMLISLNTYASQHPNENSKKSYCTPQEVCDIKRRLEEVELRVKKLEDQKLKEMDEMQKFEDRMNRIDGGDNQVKKMRWEKDYCTDYTCRVI